MLQAFLVVPGLALAFLVAAPVALWPRIGKLLAGAAAMVVTGGIVPGAGQPVARGLAALHRRLDRQQPAAACVGLQRNPARRSAVTACPVAVPPAAHRRSRWRPGRRGQPVLRRRARDHPAVRRVDGCRGLLAAAGGADRSGGGAVVHPPRAAHRQRPRQPAVVGRLAAGHRCRVQLHGRHHPSVLHGGVGAGDRRAGRDLGASNSGVAGSSWLRGSFSRRCPRRPASGRSSCSTAPRTGCPGCAGWCSSARSWWPRSSRPARTDSAAPRWWWSPPRSCSVAPRSAAYAIETATHAHHRADGRCRARCRRKTGRAVRRVRRAGWIRDPGGPDGPGASVSGNTDLQALVKSADNRWAAATIGSMGTAASNWRRVRR